MSPLPIQPVDATLYVVTPIVNPCRYRSRYALYRDFEKYIIDAGAVLYTIEAAYGDRDFEITDAANPRHVRLRSSHEIWHKENLLNIGVSRLPADWKYLAWIDADVRFVRPDIVAETIHQLQHFSVVQMFAHATDLGPKHESLRSFEGFVAQWMHQGGRTLPAMEQYSVWHPGYAWACRREAWDHLGGLIDFAIVGSADRYMACALIGKIAQSLSGSRSLLSRLHRMVLRVASARRDLYQTQHRFRRWSAAALLPRRQEKSRLLQPISDAVEQPVRSGEGP
jgi:hypothetical protein